MLLLCPLWTVFFLGSAPARADDNPVLLQWFETRWQTIERRTPDLFMAGYDAVWLPPPCKASDPSSPGYDVFDRFDLGSPAAPTAYGTEADLRALIAELHRTSSLVYVDWIMNHNSSRTSDPGFIAAGGWPGFVLNQPGDFWGDFHNGQFQSQDPNGPNYNLWEGDLVGLIDIAQEKNYQFIRHPVAAGDPLNLPAGTIRNRPDPTNRRFYPDLGLPGRMFVNPATGQAWTIHPFNSLDATAGDAVSENATGLLMRATQWMVEDIGADGFRLDAAKHIPQWFWNNFWDAAVFQDRLTFGGSRVTPYSFVECVDSNSFTQTYIRKDGFGNRDALDLNGAGALRDIRAAQGFGSWSTVLGAHIDNQDDGFNNGSQGVLHVYSHDNGSTGGAPPPLPGPDLYALPENCYILFRPGVANIYYNSRQFASIFTSRGFWPDEGNPTALGSPDPSLVRLVRLSSGYARGEFNPLNGPDYSDVLVFERRTPLGGGASIGNVLVGVNDRYDNGAQQRTVLTSFAPGTRLHELTGNHADPVVDPNNVIPEMLTVGADRRVTIFVPNNRNPSGVAHHRGYVVYGPAAPSGTLDILAPSGQPVTTILPADPASDPDYSQRLTPIAVVTDATMSIRLLTSKTDPGDPNFDDNAVFRIDQGFRDFNGNGMVDIGENSTVVPGYEQFVTFRRPLFSNPSFANGLYTQTLSTGLLDEGIHYVSVVAFRHRSDGGDAIDTDFRRVIYVDRLPPQVELLDAGEPLITITPTFRVHALDRTVDRVYLFLDLPAGTDPLPLVGPASAAARYDRFEWRKSLGTLTTGAHNVTVVALEATGNSTVITYPVEVIIGSGDLNHDGRVTIDDLYEAFTATGYVPEGDMDFDGDFDTTDRRLLEARLRAMETQNMASPQR